MKAQAFSPTMPAASRGRSAGYPSTAINQYHCASQPTM